MEQVAIVLILMGVLIRAVNTILKKWVTDKKRKILSKRGALVIPSGIASVLLFSATWWWPKIAEATGLETTIAWDPTVFWLAIAWSTAWNLFIQKAFVEMLQDVDATLVQPLQSLTPGLLAFSVLAFGEVPSMIAIVGIALISLFTYIHMRSGMNTFWGWFVPFWRIFFLPANYRSMTPDEQTQAKKDRRGCRWAIGAALAGTMGLLGDGIAARHGDITLGLGVEMFVIMAWYIVMPWVWYALNITKKPEPVMPSSENLAHYWPQITLFGASVGMYTLMISLAYRVAPIAHIGTLKRLDTILVIPLAWIIFGEKSKMRIVTALGITAGALLLGFDPAAKAYVLNSAEEYLFMLRRIFA